MNNTTGLISEIERCTTVDGPGIRTIVFLKGCPLRCLWCHNPENHQVQPQVGWDSKKCIGCLKCISNCPQSAIIAGEKGLITDFQKCTQCMRCVTVCPALARKRFGRETDAQSVFQEILKDKAFYEASGGGVTASGGEPLMQVAFTHALFRLCRQAGISTALDTCGYATKEDLERVLEETDLVLLDIKQSDPELHKKYTGVDPGLIFSNIRVIDERNVTTWIRTPIVPGYTDQPENIRRIAEMISEINCIQRWELLPYHTFGEKKYQELQMKYPLSGLERPTDVHMQKLLETAKKYCDTRIVIK